MTENVKNGVCTITDAHLMQKRATNKKQRFYVIQNICIDVLEKKTAKFKGFNKKNAVQMRKRYLRYIPNIENREKLCRVFFYNILICKSEEHSKYFNGI